MSVWIRQPGEEGHSRRGNKFELHIQDTHFGLNLTRRFADLKAAETTARVVELHLLLGEPDKILALLGGKQFGGPVQESMPKLQPWLEQRITAWGPPDGPCCQHSIDTYREYSVHWASLGETPLNQLTTRMIMTVLDTLWKKYAISTFRSIVGVLRTALDDAFLRQLIPVNPMPSSSSIRRAFKAKQRKAVPATLAEIITPAYTAKEVNVLVEAAGRVCHIQSFKRTRKGCVESVPDSVRNPEKGLRNTVIILLGTDAGLREGEIAGLQISCVNFEKNHVVVMRQFNKYGEGRTKGGEVRFVEMSKLLAESLKAWIDELNKKNDGNPGPWLFPSGIGKRKGMPIDPGSIYQMWREILRDIQVRDPRFKCLPFHNLRHTFVSALIDEGATVQEVADRVGHKDPAVTARVYRHLFAARNSGLAEKLNDRRERALGAD